MRILAVATMRNEAPFILEWLAYHQCIGMTDFLIYSNDCEDGTDALLDRLAERGIIQHERNHSGGKKSVQWRALTKASRHKSIKDADWVYVADVDEFLCVHIGKGTIRELIEARPEADGFAVPWRMFGNNGVVQFVDQPVLDQFTRAAPEALVWPWRAVQFKSLFRNAECYDRLGVHAPKHKSDARAGIWVDGNGNRLEALRGTVTHTTRPRYGLAQINHYALGAMESFLVKVERGRPNHTSDPIDLAYWCDRNLNTVEDRRILRHRAAVAERLETLMDDGETVRLHQEGVRWRQARIKQLLLTSESFYLFARIMQSGNTQVLKMPRQVQMLRSLGAMRQAQSSKQA